MCRRCCCKSSNQGAGIAAVAVIAGAAFVAAKIGPIVARIFHIAFEALTIAALTGAAATAAIAVIWATSCILHTRRTRRPTVLRSVPAAWQVMRQEGSTHPCLACGGTGTVLRAIGSGSYQDFACPACQPVRRAG
jgi:hypothetical protein